MQLGPREQVAVDVFGNVDPDLKWLLKWKEQDEAEGAKWFEVYKDLIQEVGSGVDGEFRLAREMMLDLRRRAQESGQGLQGARDPRDEQESGGGEKEMSDA